MQNNIITISDGGKVNIPASVSMREFEIANLLGVTYQSVKAAIKRLLKSRYFYCSGGEISDCRVIPDCFGLDTVIAIAFQVESYEANLFRAHILGRATAQNTIPICISKNDKSRICC